MVCVSCQRIGEAVVAYVDHQIEIFSTNRLFDDSFCLSGTESRNIGINDKSISVITGESDISFMFRTAFFAPFYQIIIDLVSKTFASSDRNQSERSYWNIF